jgi:phosphoglycolate phosphatase/pyrophosphatase PpaX
MAKKTRTKRSFDAVLFDLDGTLADTMPLCLEAFRRALKSLIHKEFSDEEILSTFGPSEEGTLAALAPAQPEEALQSYLREYEFLHDSLAPKPFDGIRMVLNLLKRQGIFLGVVTGKGELSTAITLKKYKLEGYFRTVKTGSRLGPVKEERFREIMAEFGFSSEQILYVGDAPSDVAASRACGIRVVGAAWAPTTDTAALHDTKPDFFFDNIKAFRLWLAGALELEKAAQRKAALIFIPIILFFSWVAWTDMTRPVPKFTELKIADATSFVWRGGEFVDSKGVRYQMPRAGALDVNTVREAIQNGLPVRIYYGRWDSILPSDNIYTIYQIEIENSIEISHRQCEEAKEEEKRGAPIVIISLFALGIVFYFFPYIMWLPVAMLSMFLRFGIRCILRLLNIK